LDPGDRDDPKRGVWGGGDSRTSFKVFTMVAKKIRKTQKVVENPHKSRSRLGKRRKKGGSLVTAEGRIGMQRGDLRENSGGQATFAVVPCAPIFEALGSFLVHHGNEMKYLRKRECGPGDGSKARSNRRWAAMKTDSSYY